ncbi:MAG: sulfite exporter TauE/SafE family protein [Deltaproteobacteria bacterium]|nr:sulfite exporter TauE/SafE family protein [Deltaproteobacteria bacterium]
MDVSQWAVVAFASVLGSLAQGATGFGSALVAIPIMLWGNLSLPAAIAVNTAIITLQGVTSCWRHRATIPWKETNAMVGLRLLSVPFGVLALAALHATSPATVKQVVGATLLAVLAFLITFKIEPRPSVRPAWTAVAGISSGFLTGAVGMGGPPLVTWTLMHDWEPARARGFLWATSLQMIPVSLALLVWQFGFGVLWFFALGLVAFPLVVVGNRWGMGLSATWSRQYMRRVTYALLAFTALLCISSPWLQRSAHTHTAMLAK